ncbi:hypothetical protein PENSPDRAFT_756062 [Peniophora sp. CONT]|nr:hypothetical protein PENSPDRAFT_756062 [Peniophora sp. CONT]
MPTTAPNTPSVVNPQATITNQRRLVISDKLRENAKGAVKTTVELMGFAAQMTQNVPYLGAISTALAEFMKIQDEVDNCKDECKNAVDDAAQINALIKEFRDKCVALGRGDTALNETLREAFTELERIVLECVSTLQKCKLDARGTRHRLRVYWKRAELSKSVKKCAADMRKALDRFDRTLNANTAFMLENIECKVDEMRVILQSPSTPQEAATVASLAWRLRATNSIFHGRESEVDAAVDLIMNRTPARVAILGTGGIGKTSIALATLHDARVEELYGDKRCFMSCEAATTADAVVHALADALSFGIESGVSSEAARHRLISHLKAVSGIICLDNLETPLDADRHDVEVLLNEIAALPSIALLITSRDTSIPTIRWTFPPLAHITPFSLEAALASWDNICHGHDEYATKLAKAVDCMPLAVTLLARLVKSDGSAQSIWDRWESERTGLICTGSKEHRLYSVAASIDFSLRALGSQERIDVLGIICVLAGGGMIFNDEISKLDDSLKDRLSVWGAVSLLKQLSLVYTMQMSEKIYCINVLSPIRHHMQQNYFSDELFLQITDILMHGMNDWRRDTVLKLGLSRPGPCRERCLQFVIADPTLTEDIEVLSQTMESARALEPHVRSRLHRHLGFALRSIDEYEKSRSSVSKAIELDKLLGNRRDLIDDWIHWIRTFRNEFGCNEDECQHLDEVQNAIREAWEIGRNKSGEWDQDYYAYQSLAKAQHFVNEGRRKLHRPVVHRSGLYSNNDSMDDLHDTDREAAYNQLVLKSPPPWDISLIVETMEMSQSYEETTSTEDPSPPPRPY